MVSTFYDICQKIQALFVPSLEYRVCSLLIKYVRSEDSQLIKQLPCLKRFVDAIIVWSDPLNEVAECDIGTTRKETRKNTVKCVTRDDLVSCFLDSIILSHRLTKISNELDSLDVEYTTLRSWKAWGFLNRKDDCCFTTSAADCNVQALDAITVCDARNPIVCKRAAESSTRNEIRRDKNIVQPAERQTQEQRDQKVLHAGENDLQKKQDDTSRYVHNINQSRDDNSNKIHNFLNHESCSVKSRKTQSASTLKIIVRKMYLDDTRYLSRPIIIRLVLPCKTSDLIRCIFEIDPFLGESCLIVMKRKFQVSMYNVCSCLNGSIAKLDAKVARTLRLECSIRPGYISFKLKADGTSNADGYLFVARVPICQNICRHTIQQDSADSSRDSKLNIKSSHLKPRDNDNIDNDKYNEENDKLTNTRCSCLDQCFVEHPMLKASRRKSETRNGKELRRTINDCACDEACTDIEEVSDLTSHADKFEKSEEEHCKSSDSRNIDCDNCMEKCKEDLHSNSAPVRNDEFAQSMANDTRVLCNISIEINKGVNISSQSSKSSSQATDTSEREQACLSNARNKYNDNNYTCSITSFLQNSERDKQLVELNCNRPLRNDSKLSNKQSRMKDSSSLDSIKSANDSNCSCPRDEAINITAIDDSSKENIAYIFHASRDDAIRTQDTHYSNSMEVSSKNNLPAAPEASRLMVSSKGINVHVSCPRTTVWLSSGDDADTSGATKKYDNRKRVTNASAPSPLHEVDVAEGIADGTQCLIKTPKQPFTWKEELHSSGECRSFNAWTDVNAKNSSTCVRSKGSYRLYTIASDFTMSENREKFRVNSVISTTKYETMSPRHCQDDYFAKPRPRTTVMMTKFRKSVDKSVNRIKHLIRAKLKGAFNKRAGTTILKNQFWKRNKGFFKDIRKETVGRCIRQVSVKHSSGFASDTTLCSSCNYYNQSCSAFSRESSSVPSVQHKNRRRTKTDKERMKFCAHESYDGSEALSSFCSMTRVSPRAYDLLSSTSEALDNQQRQCDFRKGNANMTVPSSDEFSFAESYSKYLKYHTRKRERKETYDKNYERMHNRQKRKARHHTCTCNRRLSEISSSSKFHEEKPGSEVYEQFYRVFRLKNLKGFPFLRNNREANAFDCSDNDCLHKRRIFVLPTENYNSYINDIDLDLKLKLLRYVELCKNVKRTLMRTI